MGLSVWCWETYVYYFPCYCRFCSRKLLNRVEAICQPIRHIVCDFNISHTYKTELWWHHIIKRNNSILIQWVFAWWYIFKEETSSQFASLCHIHNCAASTYSRRRLCRFHLNVFYDNTCLQFSQKVPYKTSVLRCWGTIFKSFISEKYTKCWNAAQTTLFCHNSETDEIYLSMH